MMECREVIIPEGATGLQIDAYMADILGISRSAVVSMLECGEILVDGKIVKKNYKTIGGECVAAFEREIVPLDAKPEDIPLNIVYEDDDLLVINKAVGMVVHPAAGNENGTLVNALLFYCGDTLSGINGVQRPGIVHRLDKDTSGLMVVAKNDMAHTSLAAQIKEHSAFRTYQAVIHGHLKVSEGMVDAPIGRHKTDRKKMAVTYENSREAITHYKVICEYPGYSHIECRLETGRTHQIRVHMAHVGHPVVGDRVYGKGRDTLGLTGQCLHSKSIEFTHPRTNERMKFDSDLPEYFEEALNKIKNRN